MPKKERKSLSDNLLDMKFMKKSKEDREKLEEQEEYTQVFKANQVLHDEGVRITVQPNVVDLENLQGPRFSYGGQNPAVEKLMANGDGGGAAPRDEADVTDYQMAQHYSSVVDTVGNKFRTKRERSPSIEQAGRERTPSRPPVLKKVKEFLCPE